MSVEEMYEKLRDADMDELGEMKLWLFRESIRLADERCELDAIRDENRKYEEHLAARNRQIRAEEDLIEQKHEVIKRGFAELDRDRQALNAREKSIRAEEMRLREKTAGSAESEAGDVLFAGADNILLLKKRYKDLMKMFHPDCLGGDTEMVKSVNRAYDRLVSECDSYGKRRRA